MGFSPPPAAPGITKLSELEVDVSKDWGAKLIKNIGAAVDDNDAVRKVQAILQAVMTGHGDILYRGDSEALRLAAEYGIGYNFLHMTNTGDLAPEWLDIQDIIRYMTGAVNVMVAPPTLRIPQPVLSVVVAAASSPPGRTATPSLSIPAPSISKAVAATSVNAVGGAVAHDEDGVDADETTEANEATADDMTLLQADGAIEDWYALGYAGLFDGVVLNVSTVGADITLGTLEYSKGEGAWGTLIPIMNQLNDYETSGKRYFTFERPGDWAVATYAGIANMYWIKFKASAIGGGFVQPLGAQAWILVY